MITVMQVFSALGITPSPAVSWSVGNRMQRTYADEFGQQPPKDNRPKTSGSGSHCFALYPVDWQPRIEKVIRETVQQERDQGDLFRKE